MTLTVAEASHLFNLYRSRTSLVRGHCNSCLGKPLVHEGTTAIPMTVEGHPITRLESYISAMVACIRLKFGMCNVFHPYARVQMIKPVLKSIFGGSQLAEYGNLFISEFFFKNLGGCTENISQSDHLHITELTSLGYQLVVREK